MADEDTNKAPHPVDDAGKQQLSDVQKKIEEKVAKDEQTLGGAELNTELSKDRTAMSEHRTGMSEHRTSLSEHRTDLSEHRTDLSEKRSGLSEHRTDLSEKRTGMSEHRTDLSDKRTELSYQRTAMSYERTLMAWIRTSTSMISFGFTIYKFFEEVQKALTTHARIFTPRVVGLLMIAFGFLGLLFAQIQHTIAYQKMKKEYPEVQRSLSSVLGILMLVFGLMLFFAALFRQ